MKMMRRLSAVSSFVMLASDAFSRSVRSGNSAVSDFSVSAAWNSSYATKLFSVWSGISEDLL